jgi:hypothetical protein
MEDKTFSIFGYEEVQDFSFKVFDIVGVLK